MKVLVGTSMNGDAGGLTSHLHSLCKILQTAGVQCILSRPAEVTFMDKVRAVMLGLGSIDRARVALARIRLSRARRTIERTISTYGAPEVLHAHDALLGAFLVDLAAVPLVLTVHGPLSREVRMMGKGTKSYVNFLRSCEQKAYDRARAIIAVDSGQRDIIVTDFNIPLEKVSVVFNAVDTGLFCPRNRSKQVSPYFLVPRRLVKKNGVQIAIDAFRRLSPSTTAELWIAGDGPEGKMLRELVCQYGLEERVRFLGGIPQIDMITAIADAMAVIVPSVPVEGVIEASSIAALEAMATGRLVIASRIGGLAEIIKDGETGCLFEAGDSVNLAMLMNEVISNPGRADSIGVDARKYVVENHSLAAWREKVISIYHSTLEKSAL